MTGRGVTDAGWSHSGGWKVSMPGHNQYYGNTGYSHSKHRGARSVTEAPDKAILGGNFAIKMWKMTNIIVQRDYQNIREVLLMCDVLQLECCPHTSLHPSHMELHILQVNT